MRRQITAADRVGGVRRLLLVAGLLTLALPAVSEERGLKEVQYDMLVAENCGLLNAAVVAGYRAEYDAIVARDGLGEDAQREERIAALVAFDYEYQNYGLGGARGWCRDEGQAGAARLASFAPKTEG